MNGSILALIGVCLLSGECREMVVFMFQGLLGGILWLFMNWIWTKKAIAQHTIVSAIAGYVYWILHSDYNFPNGLMALISGYFSVDFMKHVFDFFGRRMEKKFDEGKENA